LFDRQDEVEAGRNRLIDELEAQLIQESRLNPLFSVHWALI
jgi:hypothetical protein